MKIIGHTKYGYIAEIDPAEIAAITGDENTNRHAWRSKTYQTESSHDVGTEFKICDMWRHLNTLSKNERERKGIAEQLRAAASVIELTPSAFTAPPEKEQQQSV
jgi:hypothetical protein